MEPLRIGVFGAARISGNGIVAPSRLTGARLVAVAARDRARAEEFAARNGVERVLDDYRAVLADPQVEAVYNPLPNGLHGPWNLAAVEAGKHVLSEKPFASDAGEAEQVRAAGERAGVVVAEAFHYHYHPVITRLHEVIDRGELGELVRVETGFTIPAPAPQDPRWSLALAGGALMDLGCYSVHAQRRLAPWAGGEPTAVGARGGERAGLPGVDEWGELDLVFPSGATGLASWGMADPNPSMTCRVVGSLGEATVASFVLPHLDDRLTVTTGAGTRVERLGTRPSYAYQLEAFTAAVRGGAPMATDGTDAVATMTLIDGWYRATGLGPRPRSPQVG